MQRVCKKTIKKPIMLFLTFLKIGAFTFGGGYAMIPLIQKEVAEKKKWIQNDDILEIIAIAESTPGPIAINAATFVGYKIGGFMGAFAATSGVILPSFFIILGISCILKEFQYNLIVRFAFYGLRAGVLALIIKALWSMYKQAPKGILSYFIIAAAFILTAFLGIPVPFVLIGSALIGLTSSIIISRRMKQ